MRDRREIREKETEVCHIKLTKTGCSQCVDPYSKKAQVSQWLLCPLDALPTGHVRQAVAPTSSLNVLAWHIYNPRKWQRRGMRHGIERVSGACMALCQCVSVSVCQWHEP